jgi:hypothetical protein
MENTESIVKSGFDNKSSITETSHDETDLLSENQ